MAADEKDGFVGVRMAEERGELECFFPTQILGSVGIWRRWVHFEGFDGGGVEGGFAIGGEAMAISQLEGPWIGVRELF
jgi:hypothetical protein